jgi:hypothetical protein
VIVRHEGGAWTLIRQMDHAAHCGQIARAWRSGPFGADAVSAALEYAAGHHDLGWDEVDDEPEAGAEGTPLNFTQSRRRATRSSTPAPFAPSPGPTRTRRSS